MNTETVCLQATKAQCTGKQTRNILIWKILFARESTFSNRISSWWIFMLRRLWYHRFFSRQNELRTEIRNMDFFHSLLLSSISSVVLTRSYIETYVTSYDDGRKGNLYAPKTNSLWILNNINMHCIRHTLSTSKKHPLFVEWRIPAPEFI